MPSISMMNDLDVSDPWARGLEKFLNAPIRKPEPTTQEREAQARELQARDFEKLRHEGAPQTEPKLGQIPRWAAGSTKGGWAVETTRDYLDQVQTAYSIYHDGMDCPQASVAEIELEDRIIKRCAEMIGWTERQAYEALRKQASEHGKTIVEAFGNSHFAR